MKSWYRAADLNELSDGTVKRVVAGEHVIALARQGDSYYALDNRCPHAGASLCDGTIDNGTLVCPWHGREYRLVDGSCEAYQGVATYTVEVREDGIFVSS